MQNGRSTRVISRDTSYLQVRVYTNTRLQYKLLDNTSLDNTSLDNINCKQNTQRQRGVILEYVAQATVALNFTDSRDPRL